MMNAKPILDLGCYTTTKLSLFHRNLGSRLNATDLDLVEADANHNAVGLCEYKHANSKTIDLSAAQHLALRNLADRAKIGYFVIIYYLAADPQLTDFNLLGDQALVIPANKMALKIMKGKNKMMSKRGFSIFLHKMRGLEPSESEMAHLTAHVTLDVPKPFLRGKI
jgi:hypothetical protein